jgi:hypothetical protein
MSGFRVWHAVVVGGVAALVAGGYLWYPVASSIGLVALLGALTTILTLVRLVAYLMRRTPDRKRRLVNGVFCLGAAAVAAVGLACGRRHLDAELSQRFAPVLTALGHYREANGSYPERLDQALSEPPECPGGRGGYHRQSDDEYCITCVTVGFDKLSWCSGSSQAQHWE